VYSAARAAARSLQNRRVGFVMAPGNGADVNAERQYACTICRVLYRSDFSRCPRDGGEVVAIDTWDDPLLGATLAGRYLIEELIGEGGMGRVYRACHHELPRNFAIKVLFGELAALSDMRARFRKEAESAARLDHPNLVPVLDVGETDEGLLYLAMEYVAGQSLRTIIDSEGPLDAGRSASLARRLCRGLQHAHDRGMVHRDFKPDNVLVVEEDGVEVPRIVDFGLAVLAEETRGGGRLTRKGETMGTPPYMSPEQLTGRPVDARSDLFSLGVVLYEMLTGKTPFEGTMFEMVRQIATEAPPPMSTRAPDISVPPELERIALKLLATRPEDRYASAAEVIAELEAVAPAQKQIGRRTSGVMALTSAPAPLLIDDEPAPPVSGRSRRAASDTGAMLALVKRRRRALGAIVLAGVGAAIAGVVVTLVLRGNEDGGGGADETTTAMADTAAPPAPATAPAPAPAPAPVPTPAVVADAAPVAAEPVAAAPEEAAAAAPEPPAAPASASALPVKDSGKDKSRTAAKPRSDKDSRDKEKSRPVAAPAAPAQSVDDLYRDGTKLYLGGHLADAKKKYESALAQNSRYPAAHRGLGYVYQRLGDRAKALKHLKRYLELSPRARDVAEVKKRIEALGG